MTRGRRWRFGALLAVAAWGATACLTARAVERNYFVLHGEPIEKRRAADPVDGLVRVRDMDTDSVYEKFQIVVRRSPYQLRYSDQNVWAVKPNQMVSDLIAQALESSNSFTGVTRQLLDARPEFTMSGKLHAVELYDSGDLWFAHVSLHLRLTRFAEPIALWTFEFDQRKQIDPGAFDHGVRALSELLHDALKSALAQVGRLDFERTNLARRQGQRRASPPEPSKDPPASAPMGPVAEPPTTSGPVEPMAPAAEPPAVPDPFFVREQTGIPAAVTTSSVGGGMLQAK